MYVSEIKTAIRFVDFKNVVSVDIEREKLVIFLL